MMGAYFSKKKSYDFGDFRLNTLLNHAEYFREAKINNKNVGKQTNECSQLPPLHWLYLRRSKAEWRAIG